MVGAKRVPLVATHTRAFSSFTSAMGQAKLSMLMETHIQVNGKQANAMARGNTTTRTATFMMEPFSKVR